MNFFGVSLTELIATCENLNINTSGGFINEYGNKYIVRGIARTESLSEIAGSLIKIDEGRRIRVRDVADVNIGRAPAIGTGSYRGRDAVLITITKQPDANTVKL
jgi:Cu/Ag efflux pump CusA